MKVNRYGRAAILTPAQISLLFTEGFVKPRDKALFGVCLYAAARINEACTLLRGDVIGFKGVRSVLVIRSYNTKGKQETRYDFTDNFAVAVSLCFRFCFNFGS